MKLGPIYINAHKLQIRRSLGRFFALAFLALLVAGPLFVAFPRFLSAYDAPPIPTLRAFVSNDYDNTVSVIDVAGSLVVHTIQFAQYYDPEGITLDRFGTSLYVVGYQAITNIDPATFAIRGSASLGANSDYIALTPNGMKAYVTNFNGGTITVVNTLTNTVTGVITDVLNPQGIAMTPNGLFLFVANGASYNSDGYTVTVYRMTDSSVVTKVIVGRDPFQIAITPDGRKAYVTHPLDHKVSVIDTLDYSFKAIDFPTSASPRAIAITPNGARAYVTDYNRNLVSIIDTNTDMLQAVTIGVGSAPSAIAITPDGSTAIVTNEGAGTAQFINLGNNTVTNTIKVGSGPRSITIGNINLATKPDLLVTKITPSNEEGSAQPPAGSQVKFTAVVTNNGPVASGANTLGFYLDGTTRFSTAYVPALQPYTYVTVSATESWLATSGTHKITAIVDNGNVVDERDEANNSRTGTVIVPAPTLTCSAGPDQTIAMGTFATVSASASGGSSSNYSFAWQSLTLPQYVRILYPNQASTPVGYFPTPATYTLRVTCRDSQNHAAFSDTHIIVHY